MVKKLVIATVLTAGLTVGAATPALGHAHVHTGNHCQNLGGQSTHAANGLHVAQHASAKVTPEKCEDDH
jgi:hypothetical protein